MSIWIEITKQDHKHGGVGWEYGSCLWSPTTNKTGRKIYEIMKRPLQDEIVLHFYKISNVTFYHGYSIIKDECIVTNEIPPQSGNWDWANKFYRIELKKFTKFSNPISINDFTKIYDFELRNEINEYSPSYYPFEIAIFKDPKFKKDSIVKLSQGKYLRQCSDKLFTLLQETTKIHEIKSNEPEIKNTGIEYVEGLRQKREAYFFMRNPKLVKDAKIKYGYVCQACNFDFSKFYGSLGENYIECHHENVLSERSEEEWDKNITTSIDDVKVLCSNCHRMLHRSRPALTFKDLLKYIK